MVRRVWVVFAGVLGVGCAVLALGAGPASAVLSYPFDGQLVPAGGAFGFLEPGSVAVDDGNGDTYVADSGSGVVDVFETSSGAQLAGLDGSLTPAGSFGGGRVGVAANNGTGAVYVLDATDNVVDVFESNGAYRCQITGSVTPSASECNGVAGSATPAGGFNGPGGVAVDQATGEVYVVDANNGVVDVFSVAGAYVRQISLGSVPGGFSAEATRGVAVDDFNGFVYVSDSGAKAVYVFNGAGGYEATWTGANTPGGSFGLFFVSAAADDSTGDVYVTESYPEGVTDVFEPSGGYVTQFSHSIGGLGTAVDQASHRVYVSSDSGSTGIRVEVFGPGVLVPEVVTGAAEEVGSRSVRLGGTVNPDGLQVSDCHFDYVAEAEYNASAPDPYSAGGTVPCVPAAASIPVDSEVHAVSAQVAGLTPGTVYHFRLQASTEGAVFGGDASFSTLPLPAITAAFTARLTASSVDLAARVNPGGLDTTYHFEWGTSTAYGTSVPVPDGDIGAGTSDVPVSVHLSGLTADTTYHWRVVAVNASGTTATGDQTFIYDTTSAGLPDGRAYEMVTPPQKNGALIGDVLFGLLPGVSEDGSRVIVSSIQCFADAGSCNADRQDEGDPYAFTRTGGGWVATALAPPATRFDQNTNWLISADAGTALFGVPTPSAGEDDFYARRPDGSVVDIGPTTPPADGLQGPLPIGGAVLVATADLSHVVYMLHESLWPFDTTNETLGRVESLYEYVGVGDAQPVLVGVSGGPGSTDLISACETDLGSTTAGTGYSPGALSADGRTVFFTARACTSGSGVNAGVPVPADTVYARIDGSRTVRISGGGAASFDGASADGSKAFFGEGENLYEYDFDNPVGQRVITVSAGDTSGHGPRASGTLAMSPDGSHVYFLAGGVLSGVANSEGQMARDGASNLYVFERDASYPAGRVSFIATLTGSDEGFVGGEANVTPDGRFLVFVSHGDLTRDDTSTTGVGQVFRYDALTGRLVRISVGERGFNDNGNTGLGNGGGELGTGDASIVNVPRYNTARAGFVRSDPTMSHDGSFVFFQSPVGLTPRALNDVQIGTGSHGEPVYAQNVYEWHEGQVYLISDGRDVSNDTSSNLCRAVLSAVCLLGSDGTGANVFFTTTDPLVAQDTDTQADVYDARICTAGNPCVAAPASVASCVGEACHGVPGGAPSLLAPASASFAGAGNLASAVTKPVVAKRKAKPKRHRRSRRRRGRGAARGGRHVKRGGK